jgi:hypothetical protein
MKRFLIFLRRYGSLLPAVLLIAVFIGGFTYVRLEQ